MNISERNLAIAENVHLLLKNRQEKGNTTKLSGDPYYQVYKNFDYWLRFNNQNA